MKTNPDVQTILEGCKKARVPVFISSNGLDIAFQTVIKDLDGSSIILENMVRPEYISRFVSGEKYFLQCKMLRFQTTSVNPRGSFMSFEVHENSLVEETRQSERLIFSKDEKVIAEIMNPFDKKTILRRHVMDMSANGLSLRINTPSRPFAAGVFLPQVKVAIADRHWTTTAAEVVYNRKFMDLQGHLRVQVGLKFHHTPGK
jgi:hypothetical protein